MPHVEVQCISSEDFASASAFAIRSENPLSACPAAELSLSENVVAFRIVCPGHNRGYAKAHFETNSTGYRGRIDMNMGGKNMTMTETQIGRRLGECE